MVAQAAQAAKPKARPSVGAPKPKPGDKYKREMTYAEKQKLSVNLGKLPGDKLDKVLQIITEHNPTFGSQQGEEIELDIDSLNVETLWELDRYVVNCMKSKSKSKSKGGSTALLPAAHAPGPDTAFSQGGRDAGQWLCSVFVHVATVAGDASIGSAIPAAAVMALADV